MKPSSLLCTVLMAVLLMTASLAAQAQTKKESGTPREGFWVIETSPKSRQCIVRFYTNDQKLIYEETLNRSLNIARRQIRRQLNAALGQTMFVWNATHQVPTDHQWVAVQFDKR